MPELKTSSSQGGRIKGNLLVLELGSDAGVFGYFVLFWVWLIKKLELHLPEKTDITESL